MAAVKGRLAVHVPEADPEAESSKPPERKSPIVLKSIPPEVSRWDGHLSGDSWAIEEVGVGNPIKGPTGF